MHPDGPARQDRAGPFLFVRSHIPARLRSDRSSGGLGWIPIDGKAGESMLSTSTLSGRPLSRWVLLALPSCFCCSTPRRGGLALRGHESGSSIRMTAHIRVGDVVIPHGDGGPDEVLDALRAAAVGYSGSADHAPCNTSRAPMSLMLAVMPWSSEAGLGSRRGHGMHRSRCQCSSRMVA